MKNWQRTLYLAWGVYWRTIIWGMTVHTVITSFLIGVVLMPHLQEWIAHFDINLTKFNIALIAIYITVFFVVILMNYIVIRWILGVRFLDHRLDVLIENKLPENKKAYKHAHRKIAGQFVARVTMFWLFCVFMTVVIDYYAFGIIPGKDYGSANGNLYNLIEDSIGLPVWVMLLLQVAVIFDLKGKDLQGCKLTFIEDKPYRE